MAFSSQARGIILGTDVPIASFMQSTAHLIVFSCISEPEVLHAMAARRVIALVKSLRGIYEYVKANTDPASQMMVYQMLSSIIREIAAEMPAIASIRFDLLLVVVNLYLRMSPLAQPELVFLYMALISQ
ncbi:hypothetical protein KIPB_015257, partial [Kipferlia bialata]|eukprot:g15257.t1